MGVQVRRLGAADVVAAERTIRALKGSCRTPEALTAFLSDPANVLVAADVDGAPAGFLLAYRLARIDRDAGQMFIYEVDVAPAHRRKGLATALIERIRDLALAEGMIELFVLTSRGNGAARALYSRSGGVVEDDAAILFVYPLDGAQTAGGG